MWFLWLHPEVLRSVSWLLTKGITFGASRAIWGAKDRAWFGCMKSSTLPAVLFPQSLKHKYFYIGNSNLIFRLNIAWPWYAVISFTNRLILRSVLLVAFYNSCRWTFGDVVPAVNVILFYPRFLGSEVLEPRMFCNFCGLFAETTG